MGFRIGFLPVPRLDQNWWAMLSAGFHYLSCKVQQSSKQPHFKGELVDFVVKDLNVHLDEAKRAIQQKLKLMLPIF